MNTEERQKRKAEVTAYFASIAHLDLYFDLQRARPFTLKPEIIKKIDALLSRHKIPVELNTDLRWIFGYVGMQYTVDFERDKKKWKAERDKAIDPATKEGILLYHWLGHGGLQSDTVEKITITVKGRPRKIYTVTYPELIYFMLQAVMDKYSLHPNEDETGVKGIIQNDEWDVEKFTEYDKWKTADYLTYRKKETVKELYSYLSDKTQFGTDALCRFGAELMFEAGVPFRHGKKKNAPLHDTFVEEIKDQFLRLIPKEDLPRKGYDKTAVSRFWELWNSRNDVKH